MNRQYSLIEKQKLLKEMGINEMLSSCLHLISNLEVRKIIEKHDEKCNYNACPMNLLTFGLDNEGRTLQFRYFISGDPRSRCSMDRDKRTSIWFDLPLELRELLPTKCVADYEIKEDEMLAKMTETERTEYLRKKEESKQKWINSLKNNEK